MLSRGAMDTVSRKKSVSVLCDCGHVAHQISAGRKRTVNLGWNFLVENSDVASPLRSPYPFHWGKRLWMAGVWVIGSCCGCRSQGSVQATTLASSAVHGALGCQPPASSRQSARLARPGGRCARGAMAAPKRCEKFSATAATRCCSFGSVLAATLPRSAPGISRQKAIH